MTEEQQITSVIARMYAMISGPAGPRDWSRNSECFVSDALQTRTWNDDEGRAQRKVLTIEQYELEMSPYLDAHDFDEKEISRCIDIYRNIAQVCSEFEIYASSPDGPVTRRGVNLIQLFKVPDVGWRITSMIWEGR